MNHLSNQDRIDYTGNKQPPKNDFTQQKLIFTQATPIEFRGDFQSNCPPWAASTIQAVEAPSELMVSLVSVAGEGEAGESCACSEKPPPKSDTGCFGSEHSSKIVPCL